MTTKSIIQLAAIGLLSHIGNWCAVYGKDFCAVTISVVHADGTPVPLLEAALVDHLGTVVDRKTVTAGRVEFCDFDFGRYSILLGNDRCGSVRIQNIHVIFGLEQKLKAVFDMCADEGDRASAHACFVYVRTRGPSGDPLPGVNIAGSFMPQTTDSYGRAIMGTREGQKETLVLSKTGYKPQNLVVDCTSKVNDVLERAVTLDREP